MRLKQDKKLILMEIEENRDLTDVFLEINFFLVI